MLTTTPLAVPPETCEIRKLSGRALARGPILLRTRNRQGEFVVGLERPGELLQRCLVEGLHDVQVAVDGRPRGRATVVRFAFTADHGRVCVLGLPLYELPQASALSVEPASPLLPRGLPA